MIKIYSFLLCTIFLSSCSGVYFNSNVEPYMKNKVQRAIRSSIVDAYTRNEIWQLNASNLGIVETDFCQINLNGSVPSESTLRKRLKVKTQLIGGNGIVYDSCERGSYYLNCKKYIRCQATAYKIKF